MWWEEGNKNMFVWHVVVTRLAEPIQNVLCVSYQDIIAVSTLRVCLSITTARTAVGKRKVTHHANQILVSKLIVAFTFWFRSIPLDKRS